MLKELDIIEKINLNKIKDINLNIFNLRLSIFKICLHFYSIYVRVISSGKKKLIFLLF